MATNAPLTFAQQEMQLIRITLQARGWSITDAREDDQALTIIATKPLQPAPISGTETTKKA